MFSGVGIASEAPLARPEGLLLDEQRGFLYLADTGNGLVRRVELVSGRIETIAGTLDGGLPPSINAQPATEVDLQRPMGLALDGLGQRLYVADTEAGQVLEVSLTEPRMLRSLLDPQAGFHPVRLAFHTFASGSRILFVADRGQENVFAGASGIARPALHSIDLSLQGVLHLDSIALVFGPDDRYTSLRSIADMAVQSRGDGSASLFLTADVGEEFETYLFGGPSAFSLGFELDCHDGQDDDGDGRVDFDDADCREVLQAQILRVEVLADGSDQFSPDIALFASGFRKFPVELALFDPFCGSAIALLTPPRDYPELIPTALALAIDEGLAGPPEALFVFDPLEREVSFLRPSARVQMPVFGTGFDLALPFDGSSPRTTKLDHPRALVVDGLENLFVADTVHNRIRRAWVGDLLGQ